MNNPDKCYVCGKEADKCMYMLYGQIMNSVKLQETKNPPTDTWVDRSH